jgi:hypothetical protein
MGGQIRTHSKQSGRGEHRGHRRESHDDGGPRPQGGLQLPSGLALAILRAALTLMDCLDGEVDDCAPVARLRAQRRGRLTLGQHIEMRTCKPVPGAVNGLLPPGVCPS